MNRTTLSLIAGTTALAAVTGFAALSAPDTPGAGTTAKAAAQLPVERTSLLCPAPSMSDIAETSYTSFTPVTKGTGGGKAELQAAAQESKDGAGGDKGKDGGKTGERKTEKPVLTPKEPGKPVTGDSSGAESPALVGTADGRFAPGWTVQETTEVAAGTGRGLQGVNCTAPDTSFWFPGASTAADRTDYVHLTNPDDSAAVVDIELYGKDGTLKSTVGEASRSSRTPPTRSCCPPSPTSSRPTSPCTSMSAAGGSAPPCRPWTTSSAATGWPRPRTRRAAWSCPASPRTPLPCAWSPSPRATPTRTSRCASPPPPG